MCRSKHTLIRLSHNSQYAATPSTTSTDTADSTAWGQTMGTTTRIELSDPALTCRVGPRGSSSKRERPEGAAAAARSAGRAQGRPQTRGGLRKSTRAHQAEKILVGRVGDPVPIFRQYVQAGRAHAAVSGPSTILPPHQLRQRNALREGGATVTCG